MLPTNAMYSNFDDNKLSIKIMVVSAKAQIEQVRFMKCPCICHLIGNLDPYCAAMCSSPFLSRMTLSFVEKSGILAVIHTHTHTSLIEWWSILSVFFFWWQYKHLLLTPFPLKLNHKFIHIFTWKMKIKSKQK